MATLPKATTTVSAESGGVAAGSDMITIIAPVAANDDAVPRVFGSAKACYEFHGYNEGVEYAAIHVEETRKPFMFVGIPIETPGTISAEVTDGNSGTCETTVTAGADGVLHEHDGVLTVITGGIIGTHPIVLSLSLDGGLTSKRIRLGTANSYVIPYQGITIGFAPPEPEDDATLVAGDVIHTWHGSQPKGDSDGLALARANLAAQQKLARTWLIIGDLETAAEGAAVVANINAYETANERFQLARCAVRDIVSGAETKAEYIADAESELSAVADEYRVDLGIGRARKLSPFSGWIFRRPVSWAASVREYQHDLHVATWKKDEGPLSGWTLLDADGNLAEYDDRVDGGAASAALFTSFRSWANGPNGAFISQSLTRAPDLSILSYTHNVHVVNLAQTTVHAATELTIGSSLVLNPDGTATSDSLATIQQRVNSALERALLSNRGEGVRASRAVWTPSADDDLSGAEAVLTGVLDLVLNGTIHSVATTIKVS